MHVELGELTRRKELAGGQERNRLHRATGNGAWLSAVPHFFNCTGLSWEEFQDNLRLRYGLMLQDIPATCDGCGKNFLIKHAISCPKGGLVLSRHDGAAKEWVTLGSRALFHSALTYEPKINSITVQGERTGAKAPQENDIADGGADNAGESQGGIERTVNRAVRVLGRPGQVQVPLESREDISTHGFWKQGTTTMFDIRIVNLYVGSYLHMTPEKSLVKA